jgi:hypothetical protein
MKKLIAAFAVSVALLAGLAGCGSSNNSATDSVAPAPVDTYVAPVVTPHDQFLSDVNSLGDPIISNTSDADLWSMATATCSALDEGNSISSLMNYLISSGTMTSDNAQTIGEIIGASVKDVCPSHIQEVQDFINQNSSTY